MRRTWTRSSPWRSKRGVVGDADGDVEVAGDAAARRGGPAAGEAEPLTVVDARGHLDVDGASTRARGRRRGIRGTASGSGCRFRRSDARRRGDDLAEDRAPDLADLAGAAADVATRRVRARLATRALAARAR